MLQSVVMIVGKEKRFPVHKQDNDYEGSAVYQLQYTA